MIQGSGNRQKNIGKRERLLYSRYAYKSISIQFNKHKWLQEIINEFKYAKNLFSDCQAIAGTIFPVNNISKVIQPATNLQ